MSGAPASPQPGQGQKLIDAAVATAVAAVREAFSTEVRLATADINRALADQREINRSLNLKIEELLVLARDQGRETAKAATKGTRTKTAPKGDIMGTEGTAPTRNVHQRFLAKIKIEKHAFLREVFDWANGKLSIKEQFGKAIPTGKWAPLSEEADYFIAIVADAMGGLAKYKGKTVKKSDVREYMQDDKCWHTVGTAIWRSWVAGTTSQEEWKAILKSDAPPRAAQADATGFNDDDTVQPLLREQSGADSFSTDELAF